MTGNVKGSCGLPVPSSKGSAWLGGLILILGLLGISQQGGEAEVSERAGVGVFLEADKGTYIPGEPITLTLRVVNHSPQPVSLYFRDAQRHDFIVQDPHGHEVWRWAAGRVFAQALGEETLPPAGGELTYRITVRERLSPGRYAVIGTIPAQEELLSESITISID